VATKEKNGDVSIRISKSLRGKQSENYRSAIQRWTDKDWELVDENEEGAFVGLRFRYKRFVLRPRPAGLIYKAGESTPVLPHVERFLTRDEAVQAAEKLGNDRFIVDESEPPTEI
jgi:hypothetical protein